MLCCDQLITSAHTMTMAVEVWLLLCTFATTLITHSDPYVLQFMFALLTDYSVCIIMKMLRASPCEVPGMSVFIRSSKHGRHRVAVFFS